MQLDLKRIRIIQVGCGYLTEAQHWSYFTRYLEPLSHFVVVFYALILHIPDVFVDTMTGHFAMFGVKLINRNIKVVNYVHYPYTTYLYF